MVTLFEAAFKLGNKKFLMPTCIIKPCIRHSLTPGNILHWNMTIKHRLLHVFSKVLIFNSWQFIHERVEWRMKKEEWNNASWDLTKCPCVLRMPRSFNININICCIELKWDGKITKIWYDNEMRWIRITVWSGGDLSCLKINDYLFIDTYNSNNIKNGVNDMTINDSEMYMRRKEEPWSIPEIPVLR